MRTNIFVLFFFYKNYIFFKIQDPFHCNCILLTTGDLATFCHITSFESTELIIYSTNIALGFVDQF